MSTRLRLFQGDVACWIGYRYAGCVASVGIDCVLQVCGTIAILAIRR